MLVRLQDVHVFDAVCSAEPAELQGRFRREVHCLSLDLVEAGRSVAEALPEVGCGSPRRRPMSSSPIHPHHRVSTGLPIRTARDRRRWRRATRDAPSRRCGSGTSPRVLSEVRPDGSPAARASWRLPRPAVIRQDSIARAGNAGSCLIRGNLSSCAAATIFPSTTRAAAESW